MQAAVLKRKLGFWLGLWLLMLSFVIILGISVDGGRVTTTEASLFRLINHLPNQLYPFLNLVQFSGVLAAPAFCAALAALYKRYLLAVSLLLIMPLKLINEDIIKFFFQRERPKVYIPDAILRGDVQASGLSFVSGHAVIVFALATALTPFLTKRLRVLAWSIAGLCIFARVYLGAHLPRDVFGGAAAGVMIGLLVLGFYTLMSRWTAKLPMLENILSKEQTEVNKEN